MSLMDLSLADFKKEYLIPSLENFMRMDIAPRNCSLKKIKPGEVVYSVRIAMHLRDRMIAFEDEEGFRIDCEYDKEAGEGKSSYGATLHENMRPDFIIHKRTLPRGNHKEDNFLVCEVKKENESSKQDISKVKKSIEERNYRFGLCISKIANEGLCLMWYGDKINISPLEEYRYENERLILISYKRNHLQLKL